MIKLRNLLPESLYDDPARWEFLNKQWQHLLKSATETKQFKNYTLYYLKNTYEEYSKILATDHSGTIIGELFFGKPSASSNNIEGAIQIHPDHRRRGIASEMYEWAEKLSGMIIQPSYPHSPSASKFWNQPNIKFGPMKQL